MDLELCMSQTGTEQGPESVSALLPYMPGRRVDARSRTGWNEENTMTSSLLGLH